MAAFIRRQFSGASRNTTTTTLLGVAGTSVDIAATTGWPSIAGVPFYVVINPSSIYEEKCLATISGSTLTLVRAQDDTTASEHPIGSVIYPVFTANDADEANELVSKLTTKGDLLTTDGTNLLRLGVGPNGYFLKASTSASAGVEWASIPTINSLNDIGDVTINNVEEGDFLVYKNSASAWINETIHFITVSDTEPTDEIRVGDLWYNSSELELYTYYSGSWIQVTLTPEFPKVEELDNVYISTANTGDVLAFDGLDWYNDTVSNLLGSHIISLSGDVSGSVLFDSSASVNISTSIQPNSVALGTDTTGNYVNDVTAGTGVVVTHTPSEGSSPTIAIGQAVGTSSSVQFAHISAPLTGNVTGNITGSSGSTTGNAATATALQNARIISLSGDVSGSVSFDGSANATISASIQPNSVALGTDTTGNYMSDLTQGTGITITHTPGEGSNATIAIGQAVGTSASVTFANINATGDLVVGGDLTVNGTTTTLNTETLEIEDNIIVLNSNVSGSPLTNAGVEVQRGTSDNVSIRWNETSDKWEITEDGSAYLEIGTTADISAAALTSLSDLPDVSTAYQIGATGPAGGIIFITPDTIGNSTGKYFEVAPSASQVQRSWATGGNQSSAVSGADATAIGFGSQNTIDIVAQSGNVSATSAAAYASGYEYGGFSDWFLPSIDELQELYAVESLEAGTIPGLLSNNYWSSTEHSATQAKYENLGDGGQGFSAKSNSLYVRPVRAFNSPASGDFLKWNGSYWTNDPNLPTVSVSNSTIDDNSASMLLTGITVDSYGRVTGRTAATHRKASTTVPGIIQYDDDKFDYSDGPFTIKANGIELGADTTGNYMSDLTQGTGVTITHTPGEGSNATIAIGQVVSTSSSVTFANVTSTGNVAISGRIDKTTIRESVADTSVSASVVTADYATGDIFYVGTAPGSNFTVNLTNAPTDNGKAITVVIFVTQGATGYIPNAVQVAGSAQTIKWANGAAPTPTSSAGKIDIFSFTFVRRSSAWTVFGSSNLGY